MWLRQIQGFQTGQDRLWPADVCGVVASQVCELDIIFNFEKAYFILDEFLLGGEAQETSKKNVLKAIEQADLLQEVRTVPYQQIPEIRQTNYGVRWTVLGVGQQSKIIFLAMIFSINQLCFWFVNLRLLETPYLDIWIAGKFMVYFIKNVFKWLIINQNCCRYIF